MGPYHRADWPTLDETAQKDLSTRDTLAREPGRMRPPWGEATQAGGSSLGGVMWITFLLGISAIFVQCRLNS